MKYRLKVEVVACTQRSHPKKFLLGRFEGTIKLLVLMKKFFVKVLVFVSLQKVFSSKKLFLIFAIQLGKPTTENSELAY